MALYRLHIYVYIYMYKCRNIIFPVGPARAGSLHGFLIIVPYEKIEQLLLLIVPCRMATAATHDNYCNIGYTQPSFQPFWNRLLTASL